MKKKKKVQSQYERSRVLRARLRKFFPEMDSIKQELGHLLDEAQNSPPAGISDGTINEIQFNQLRDIHDALQKLLVAQLFNLQPDRRSIWARKEARRR